MLLFGDLHRVCVEVCIITCTINGCIFIHPYFQFYINGDGMQPFTINPMFIYLGYDNKYKLTKYSEQMKSALYVRELFKFSFYVIMNFRLYLSVVMLKNDELLKNQPIQPFPSLDSSM